MDNDERYEKLCRMIDDGFLEVLSLDAPRGTPVDVDDIFDCHEELNAFLDLRDTR